MEGRLVLTSLGPTILQGLDSPDACDAIVLQISKFKRSSLSIRRMLYTIQLLRSESDP